MKVIYDLEDTGERIILAPLEDGDPRLEDAGVDIVDLPDRLVNAYRSAVFVAQVLEQEVSEHISAARAGMKRTWDRIDRSHR